MPQHNHEACPTSYNLRFWHCVNRGHEPMIA
jgi:hypothetical protein